MGTVTSCPDCGKMIATIFPMHHCFVILRYYVAPVPTTIRGWLVKRVVLLDGKETTDNYKVRYQTKREAKAEAEKANRKLKRLGTYRSVAA